MGRFASPSNDFSNSEKRHILSKYQIDGSVVFDSQAMTLSRGDIVTTLTANETELLCILMQGTASKQAVIEQIWESKGLFVTEGSYHQLVRALRVKLDEQGIPPTQVKTLPRLGLRFLGFAELLDASPPSPDAHAASASPPPPASSEPEPAAAPAGRTSGARRSDRAERAHRTARIERTGYGEYSHCADRGRRTAAIRRAIRAAARRGKRAVARHARRACAIAAPPSSLSRDLRDARGVGERAHLANVQASRQHLPVPLHADRRRHPLLLRRPHEPAQPAESHRRQTAQGQLRLRDRTGIERLARGMSGIHLRNT
ncbi:putative transcriptional regulator [Burkholderia pseudomallei Pakistan 9]|nr:putative transcriptional regulator [Burkholderia pseudomallei Pakistan 9]